MKKSIKSMIRTALVPLCASALLLPTFAAGFAPNDAYFSTYEELGEGLSFEEYYVNTDDVPQHGYLFSYDYTAEGSVLPLATTGKHVWGAETVMSMGKMLTEQGQNVIGGTNGDFFSFATGIPLGALISGGRVLSTDAGQAAFGMRADGTYIIGTPSMTVTMTRIGIAEAVRDAVPEQTPTEETSTGEGAETEPVDTESEETNSPEIETILLPEITLDTAYEKTYPIAHIGKYPAIWGAYLNTYDYGKTTRSKEVSTEFVFALCDGAITLGAPVTAILTAIHTDATDSPIPEGGFVISVQNDCAGFSEYADLAIGDAVKISVTASEGWQDVVTVIGGGDILVKNGEICEGLLKEGHAKTAKPRVAIGYTEEGTLRLFALDGKGKSYGATGMNLNSLAETMQALGCVEALNLDGGGSVTVALKGEDGALHVGNILSEGSQRHVSNAIFFINTAEADGVPYFVEIAPKVPIVYKNSSLPLSLTYYDRAKQAVEAPEDMIITWSAEGGDIDENGVFTPAEGIDEARVTATVTVVNDLGFEAELWKVSQKITVLDTLDALHITEAPRAVPLGMESGTAFSAVGEYKGYGVAVDCAYLTAVFAETGENTCNDGIITETLTLKSTKMDGYGILEGFPRHTVRVALKEDADIYDETDVIFGAESVVVWSMDDEKPGALFSSDENAVFLTVEAMGYDGGGALSFNGSRLIPYETPAFSYPVEAFTVWLRGDLPADIHMTLRVGEESYDIPWVRVFENERLTGYSEYRADLEELFPDGLTEFTVEALVCSETPFFAFIDNVTADFGDALTVFSDLEGSWAKDSVLKLYRMGIATGSPDGAYYAYDPSGALTRGAFAKLLCLYTSLIPEENVDLGAMFVDADEIPKWAVPYIAAVVNAGLMRGKTVTLEPTESKEADTSAQDDASEKTDISTDFSADDEKTDVSAESNAETEDVASMPTLVFCANDVMTRAEVLQVLGALMPQRDDTDGEEKEIPVFSDDEDIPNWARVNVEYCIARGIVSGFSDGTLRPTAGITRGEMAALFCRVESEM